MSYTSMDCFAPSDSTRVSSNSPSSPSSSFDSPSTVPDATVPFSLFNDYHHHKSPWAFDNSNNGGIAYTGGLFGSPSAATQQAVEAAARYCPTTTPPAVQLHNLSLSSSQSYHPCGPVTFVPTSAFAAPRPVSSSTPVIGGAWPAHFQPPPVLSSSLTPESPTQAPPGVPPRPPMQAKIPPEKGRKSFPCLHPGCGMKFPKRNALDQHMRSHTGERPEICEWCGRGFSLKCNLRRHFRTCKKKKAMNPPATEVKSSPPSSPLSQDHHSPSPGASSPLTATAAVVPSLEAAPAHMFAAPPFLWSPDFIVDPSHGRSAAIDMTCGTLFPTQFAYPNSYPTLVHAQF